MRLRSRHRPLLARCAAAFLCLLPLGIAEADAQKLPVRVRGVVMDSTMDHVLPGVVVMLDTGDRQRTDERGRFVFDGVPPGEHSLLILGMGCRASVARFDAGTDSDPARLIVVTAEFSAPETLAADTRPPDDSPGRVITADEIRDMQARTLVDVVRRVAPYMVGGPAGQVGAGTRLMGRGGRTIRDARVPLLVVDGVLLYLQDTGVLEAIPPGDVAWIEILAGTTAGWRFGTGATGGVIRIRTHRGGGVPTERDPSECLMAGLAISAMAPDGGA